MMRKARIGDVKIIHRMINVSAGKGEMLPRSLMDIYGSLRDFFIYEESDAIGGVCAMNIIWENLAEVRSLYVEESCRGRGIGRKLVEACISEGITLQLYRIWDSRKSNAPACPKKFIRIVSGAPSIPTTVTKRQW
jgi:amino-acid N-acetyltransferase